MDIVGSKPTSPAILVTYYIDNKIEDIKDLIVNYIEKDMGS